MDYNFHKSHKWKPDADDLFMQNVYAFRDIVRLFEHSIRFYFPNYVEAPWQVQAVISGEKVNFWPHKMKAHVEFTSGKAVEGSYEMVALIEEQILKDPEGTNDNAGGWTVDIDDEFDIFE